MSNREVTDLSKTASHKEEQKHSEEQKPMGKPYTLEEIEKKFPGGHLDADDFYYSADEMTYFDPWGYRFDLDETDGQYYDEFGGYYDDDGYYIPGEEYQEEYYRNYADEIDQEIENYLVGEEEEEEGEENK